MNHAESHLEGHPVEKNNQLQEPEREQRLETLFADPRRHCGQYVGEANHPRRRQVTPADQKGIRAVQPDDWRARQSADAPR